MRTYLIFSGNKVYLSNVGLRDLEDYFGCPTASRNRRNIDRAGLSVRRRYWLNTQRRHFVRLISRQ